MSPVEIVIRPRPGEKRLKILCGLQDSKPVLSDNRGSYFDQLSYYNNVTKVYKYGIYYLTNVTAPHLLAWVRVPLSVYYHYA